MEEAFKITEAERVHNERIERSRGKLCGVCMEEIISMEPSSERRFAIFQNCVHVFCLKCIRKWRSNNAYDKDLVRSCPGMVKIRQNLAFLSVFDLEEKFAEHYHTL